MKLSILAPCKHSTQAVRTDLGPGVNLFIYNSAAAQSTLIEFACKRGVMTGGGGSDRVKKGKKRGKKNEGECGCVSRGKPQVGSGVAGLIRLFPLCDWVSH